MPKQSEATERYRKKHRIVEIKLRVPQPEKDKIWDYAKRQGKSLSGLRSSHKPKAVNGIPIGRDAHIPPPYGRIRPDVGIGPYVGHDYIYETSVLSGYIKDLIDEDMSKC